MQTLLDPRSRAAGPAVPCAHCGDICPAGDPASDRPQFCCAGCETVYLILSGNDLADFYRIDRTAGRSQRNAPPRDYAWLELEKLSTTLVRYRDAERWQLELELPAIHCASCVWLLERLPRLLTGVLGCQVDITRKKAIVSFDPRQTDLRSVVELLARIGYPPTLRPATETGERRVDRGLLYRIGVAGFCFGNIMLLSFPEYLGLGGADAGAAFIETAVGYLILLLALPVLLYAGNGFLSAAYRAVTAGRVTIDLPIAVGMLALFGHSVVEIGTGAGPGYLDSFAGLVFFLLIGRWFQSYTFSRLDFDRDYRHYFPIAGHRLHSDGSTTPVASEDLREGDHILVRPGQVIPTDGRLLATPEAGIDYSFVTGEADPRPVTAEQEVFAGGRATTSALRIRVDKVFSQGYLLQLWQRDRVGDRDGDTEPSGRLVRVFTVGVLLIAAATFAYWYGSDTGRAYRSATAVLIIACPCALALATPFAYGTLQRLLGRVGCYLRSGGVIRRLSTIDTFVFDKTGTLVGETPYESLTYLERDGTDSLPVFLAMALQSTHPRSRALAATLGELDLPPESVGEVREIVGSGLLLRYRNREFRIGSAEFCGVTDGRGRTFATIDGRAVLGLNPPATRLRPGARELLTDVGEVGPVYLLSGDHPPQVPFWSDHLRSDRVHFRMSPFDKEKFIGGLQSSDRKVLMVGDGLNDAGALRAAEVGVAISEAEFAFSPACDAILDSGRLAALPGILRGCRRLRWVTGLSYCLALVYNVVGLSYAVTGTLSPVVAAILMPLSSVSVVLFAVAGAWLVFRNDIDHFRR